MNQNLAKLATDYATAALDLCSDHYSENGRRFRFTANRHIVEIRYEYEEELGWSLIADGVTVKQGDADDNLHPTQEGWLALVRLIHPTETNDREAKELFREICKKIRASATASVRNAGAAGRTDELAFPFWSDDEPRLN